MSNNNNTQASNQDRGNVKLNPMNQEVICGRCKQSRPRRQFCGNKNTYVYCVKCYREERPEEYQRMVTFREQKKRAQAAANKSHPVKPPISSVPRLRLLDENGDEIKESEDEIARHQNVQQINLNANREIAEQSELSNENIQNQFEQNQFQQNQLQSQRPSSSTNDTNAAKDPTTEESDKMEMDHNKTM